MTAANGMKILHICDVAGVASVITKYMDRLFATQSLVFNRKAFSPYNLTRGEIWSHGPRSFALSCLWKAKKYDIIHVHSFDRIIPFLRLLYPHKPIILHYHGDDIRDKWNLKQKYWSKADRVFFSTVDLPGIGTPQHAEYVPNPIDTEIFYPKPLQLEHGKLRVLIGSFAWTRKGTDTIIKALSELKSRVEATIIEYGDDYAQMISLADSLKLRLRSLPTTTHEKMCEYFWQHDLVMDQFMVGVVGNIFFEAVACGRPALGYLSSKYKEYERLPFRDVDSSEKIVKVIESFETEKDLYNMWRSQYAYVSEIHNATNVAERIFNVYKELRPNA